MKPKPLNIYISLPISGYNIDDVEARATFAAGVIERKGHLPINPFDIGSEEDKTYGQYLGEDITALIDKADAVLFLDGWVASKGCKLELAAAMIYGKQMFMSYGDIPTFKRNLQY